MPLSYHLIDGYNLLHAAGIARAHYGPGDLERSRFALLAVIAEKLEESERQRTVIVFDAAEAPRDAARRFHFREMTVEFAPESGDADARIELLIKQHSSPRQLRVVSDDNRLRQAAKRRGSKAVKCDAFLRRLQGRGGVEKSSIQQSPIEPDQSQSVDEWKSYFHLTDDELGVPPDHGASTEPRRVSQKVHPQRNASGGDAERPSLPRDLSETEVTSPSEIEKSETEIDFWQSRIDDVVKEAAPRSGPIPKKR